MTRFFEKDALYPGTWEPPGCGKVHFAPSDVGHLANRLKEMVGAGLHVPLCWEHQDTAKPMTKGEWDARRADGAKLTLGHAVAADLRDGDVLWTKLDVANDEDANRLPSVKFVSPEIVHDFIDGTGKKWPGPSITHFAVTPRPVQHTQQPFKPVQMGFPSVVRLSLADFKGNDMADEKDKVGDSTPEGDAEAGKLSDVLAALKQDGYVLPDDTTMENLLDRLHTAALTKNAADGNTDEPKDEPAEDELPPEPEDELQPVTAPPAGVAMSLEKRLTSLCEANLNDKRKALEREIDDLVEEAVIDPPTHADLRKKLAAIKLSLSDDGNLVPNEVTISLDAYRRLPRNFSFPTRRAARLSLTPATRDDDLSDDSKVIAAITRDNWKL